MDSLTSPTSPKSDSSDLFSRRGERKYHEQFDVDSTTECSTFQSSDGVCFRISNLDLAAYTNRFPSTPTNWTTCSPTVRDSDGISSNFDDLIRLDMNAPAKNSRIVNINEDHIIALPEHSFILALLFGYVKKQRLPRLTDIKFSSISDLAEAAEKYEVFSAIEVCRYEMSNVASKNPATVLSYALRHGYRDIADMAAPHTIGIPLSTIMMSLQPETFSAWMLYREGWLNVLKSATKEPKPVMHPGGQESCSLWPEFRQQFASHFGANPQTLLESEFNHMFDSTRGLVAGCRHCSIRAGSWKNRIQMGIVVLPAFSSFL